MRSQWTIGMDELPARTLFLSAFFFAAFVWNASGQDSNSTLNPDAAVPSPTPVPTDAPVEGPSTTPSSITCCYVQSACNNCTEVYNVNSIVYCCPNCRGMVLVTDLVCRCTIPKGYQVQNLQCRLSNNVVGGYDALRPSYYDGGGCEMIRASVALLALLLLTASLVVL